MFEKYKHNGIDVYVKSDLKGKHREHCLCYSCELFMPRDRQSNCPIANLLYAVDCAMGITTPIFECPEFVEKKA